MLPLSEKIGFKTELQKGNRVQIPKKVRWRFKMDTEQLLKVTVNAVNTYTGGWQSFYAKMGKDGRITIPKLQRFLLLEDEYARYVMDVILEPA